MNLLELTKAHNDLLMVPEPSAKIKEAIEALEDLILHAVKSVKKLTISIA